MRTPRTIAIASSLFAAGLMPLLAGCGGGSETTSNTTITASTTTAATPSGWKATDACSMIDKSAVAATLGGTVKSANLGAVKDQGGGFPLYSQCEFLLEDGRMLVFGAGQYTNGMTLPEQVADMRRQAAMITDSKPVDLPGLGKAAIWAADVHQLYALFGDGRYVSAALTQTDFRKKDDPVATVLNQSTAILHKAGA